MKLKLLLLVLMIPFSSAYADDSSNIYRLFPVLECPAITDEFEKMISRLDSLKAAIKEGANCRNVSLNVKSLQDLVVKDREVVMKIVEDSGDAPLTDDQAKIVREYAENVTKKVAALSDLFLHSNQCFTEDNADQQLASLAGFVNEASQLVGSLTGPWGAPIALAGNVVSGFLTGLDQVLKSRAGFDFRKREQWMSYVQNLCTYHSYSEQIEHLINPDARLAQLISLRSTLDAQLGVMLKSCEECRQIQSIYKTEAARGSREVTEMASSEVEAANRRLHKPYGTYTLQNLGLRDWVDREIKRVRAESGSAWNNVSGRNSLNRAKREIENFLIVREAPRFLQFQFNQAWEDFHEFIGFVASIGRPLYTEIENKYPGTLSANAGEQNFWNDPLPVFRSLVIAPSNSTKVNEDDDLRWRWLYFNDNSLSLFSTARTSLETVEAFCAFFRLSGKYSRDVARTCGGGELTYLMEVESGLETELVNSSALVRGEKPMLINPELEGKVVFSKDRVEALARELESRQL